MKYLAIHDVIYINQEVIQASGGLLGVRDLGLIDSAINRPRATFEGIDLYVTLFEKAAALFHSIIFNHAFLDGNKRTAVASAALTLYINGFELLTSNEKLELFTVSIVERKMDIAEIAQWLEKNSTKIP